MRSLVPERSSFPPDLVFSSTKQWYLPTSLYSVNIEDLASYHIALPKKGLGRRGECPQHLTKQKPCTQ